MITTDTTRIAGRTKSWSLAPYRWVVLVLLLEVALIAVFFSMVQNQHQVRTQAEFERQADTYVAAIQKGIERNLEVIDSIGGLYAASEKVERDDFRRFVQGPLSRHPEIQALSWNERVTHSERRQFEDSLRQEGYPEFQFKDWRLDGPRAVNIERPEYIVVTYIEPYESNQAAMGLDVSSNPTRLAALESARDAGEMMTTARITLVQETGYQYGFLIFKPIYKTPAAPKTVEGRQQYLQGYAAGVFRIGDLVEAALKDLPEGLFNIQIVDEASAAGERLLFLGQPSNSDNAVDEEQLESRGEFYLREALEIPGRQWSLLITPTSEFLGYQASMEAWGVLAGGLLIAALLVAYLTTVINHDVKTQRLADQLKVSEEQFRDLYMSAPVSYFTVGTDGLIKRCNKTAEELIGCPAKDLVGRPVFDLYSDSPQGKEKASEVFQRFVSGQAVRDEELEMQRADGTLVWVSLMMNVVRGPGGKVKESRSVAIDITERKRAEEALAYQAQLVEFIGDAIIASDESFVTTAWNRAAEEMYGWTAEEVIGRPTVDFLQPEFVDVEPDQVLRGLLEEGHFEGQVIHPRKDGTRIQTEARARALRDKDGRTTGFVSIDRDITERKRTEEELLQTTVSKSYVDNIFKSMIDMLVVIDPDGTIRTVNQATVDLLGYKEDELIGHPFATMLAEEEPFAGRELQTIPERESVRDLSLTYSTKSGEKIPVCLSGSAIRDGAGKVTAIVGVARDMREINQLQVQLVQAGKMAGLGQIGAGIAHELNQPITIIQGFAQHLRRSASAQALEEMDIIIDATHRMARIVNNISAFARQDDYKPEPAEPAVPFDDALMLISAQLRLHGVEVEKNVEETLPCVLVDGIRLQQVFLNLLGNALDALDELPEGQKKTLTLGVQADRNHVVYSFEDNGPGVPEANQSLIFDPFFTTKPPGKGTGLGLSLSYGIVADHGGEITYQRAAGGGACFTVWIPIASKGSDNGSKKTV